MATRRRTTMRSRSGTKLYAVRDESGQFKDIQTYKRAHAADLRHKSKAEKVAAQGPIEKKVQESGEGCRQVGQERGRGRGAGGETRREAGREPDACPKGDGQGRRQEGGRQAGREESRDEVREKDDQKADGEEVRQACCEKNSDETIALIVRTPVRHAPGPSMGPVGGGFQSSARLVQASMT